MMTESEMAEEAATAIYESDTKTLDRLMKRGLSVNAEYAGDSLLSCAVIFRNEEMVRYLLSKGADPTWTNSRNGQTLIEVAFEKGATSICELLYVFTPAVPEKEVKIIAGFPEDVLEQIIAPTEISLRGPLFVSFAEADAPAKWADAPAELMEWLRQYIADIRPGTQAEMSEDVKDENGYVVKTGHTRDKDTKEAGYHYFIWIKKVDDGYEWICGWYSGPLSAGGSRGKLIKKYGRWFHVDVEGWVS